MVQSYRAELCISATDVIQTSVAEASRRHGGTSMVQSYRAELCISATDSEYCGLLHLYALANVLNRAIVSIYPSVDNVGVDRIITFS